MQEIKTTEKIIWKKFWNGSKQLNVCGIANTEKRKQLVGEAIGLIQKDSKNALKDEYLGYKNYEAFGDQRCDCEYGMGPRHGSIVFSVGRNRNYKEDLTEDAIYFLKCFRDAPGKKEENNDSYSGFRKVNIQQVFNLMRHHEDESARFQEFLDAIEIDEQDKEIIKRS